MTVARVLAVEHCFKGDNPISLALSPMASAAVSTVTKGLDFPVTGATPGTALVLVEDITD